MIHTHQAFRAVVSLYKEAAQAACWPFLTMAPVIMSDTVIGVFSRTSYPAFLSPALFFLLFISFSVLPYTHTHMNKIVLNAYI